jgi:hypothetical protein
LLIQIVNKKKVDMVAVMGDVFALVYIFHVPLSLKVELSVQWSWL